MVKKFYQPLAVVSLFALAACSGGTLSSAVPNSQGSTAQSAQSRAVLDQSSSQSDGAVVYNSIPSPIGPMPSEAFEATQTSEWGDGVNLSGTGRLATVSVVMDSWACETGDGNTSPPSPNACVTTPGKTFTWPITMNVYAVCAPGTCGAHPNSGVGALLATQTKSFAIPYRPSAASTARCPDNNGQFYSALASQDPPPAHCVHGLVNVITFDKLVRQPGAPLNLPSQAIFTVAFNTADYGVNPTHTPGPYNSLNVGAWGSGGATGKPSIGTALDPNGTFYSTVTPGWYCDGGASGTGFLRLDTGPNCWTGYHPQLRVTVTNGENGDNGGRGDKEPKPRGHED